MKTDPNIVTAILQDALAAARSFYTSIINNNQTILEEVESLSVSMTSLNVSAGASAGAAEDDGESSSMNATSGVTKIRTAEDLDAFWTPPHFMPDKRKRGIEPHKKLGVHDLANAALRTHIKNILLEHLKPRPRRLCCRCSRERSMSIDSDFVDRAPSQALTEFLLFPRLPAELRLKIWSLVVLHPRIVALDFFSEESPSTDSDDDGLEAQTFWYPRVCPRSRQPPLLQINKEAREEGLKLYERRRMLGTTETYYYNPNADILYFGGDENSWSAISHIFSFDQVFPRLAIDITKLLNPGNGIWSRYHNVCAGRIMADLHGRNDDESESEEDEDDPCHPKGLKEVFFVSTSNATHIEAMNVDYAAKFRPATIWGTNDDQMCLKWQLMEQVEKVKKDEPVGSNSKTVWLGKDKPTFNFVSFEPVLDGDMSYEIVVATTFAVKNLMEGGSVVLAKFMKTSGCEIIIPDLNDKQDSLRDIAIKGPKAAVKKCERAIRDVLMEVYYGEEWYSWYFQKRRILETGTNL